MSFSPQAADCYSLLKSGSLLSACAVIENFLPSPTPPPCSSAFLSLLLSSFPGVTSLTSPFRRPTASLLFSLSRRLCFSSLFEFSVTPRLTHSPTSAVPSAVPLLGLPLSLVADFDHWRLSHALNQPLPSRGGRRAGGDGAENVPGR